VLEGVTPEWFEERYGLYIVFDDVEMKVSSEEPWVISIQGPESSGVLVKAGFPTPDEGLHITTDAGVRVARKDRTGLGGFDLIVPTSAAESTWTSLTDAGATPVGLDALEILRIRAGKPQWPVDGTEKTLIHELRLDKEVCNFNKGCYLGQEVINRVDVKGQINKRIERIVMPPGAGHAGAAIHLEDDTAVGTISSITHGPEDSVGLAVLRKAAWDAEQLNIQTDSGPIRGTIDRS
jgi:folate-binding protein YgfZ